MLLPATVVLLSHYAIDWYRHNIFRLRYQHINCFFTPCCSTIGVDHLIAFEANLLLLSRIPFFFFLPLEWRLFSGGFLGLNIIFHVSSHLFARALSLRFESMKNSGLFVGKQNPLPRFKPRTSCAESQCADHYATANPNYYLDFSFWKLLPKRFH